MRCPRCKSAVISIETEHLIEVNQKANAQLTTNAQSLRKAMTKEERKLWYDFLKKLPLTIQRQKVIGNYIVDFYCAQAKLVIELDGSQHYEEEMRAADEQRDACLRELGLRVVRYSNLDVNRNFNSVCEDVLRILGL